MKENRIIVALDKFREISKLEALASQLKGKVWGFKIHDAYDRFGPQSIRILRPYGRVFADLKFNDTPWTIANRVDALLVHNVDMFTVHALGTQEMIKAAAKVLSQLKNPPMMLGVTILTSLNEETILKEWGVDRPLEDMVYDLAFFATRAGCKGIVCSALEVPLVRKVCKKDTIIVTPGIKPAFTVYGERSRTMKNYDQKRVATPAQAIKAGADYLVIGRAITEAPDPVEAVEKITQEIKEADS